MSKQAVVECRDIVKRFRQGSLIGGRAVTALHSVSLAVRSRTTVALMGDSGSGKSTLARILAGQLDPNGGEVFVQGRSVRPAELPRHVQYVGQHPEQCFNPRFTVEEVLAEPATIRRIRPPTTAAALEAVGLPGNCGPRMAHELSGGQLARLLLVRALTALTDESAQLLILDETLSRLDHSIEAQILNLIFELQRSRPLGLLLITHNERLAGLAASEAVRMREGKIVERRVLR